MGNQLNTGNTLDNFKRKRRILAKRVANDAVNLFKVDVFNAQGFIDRGVNRWKPSKKKAGKTLVKTGAGRRGIRATKITNKGIVIKEADTNYMIYHNEGTGKLPKRQFMGNSATLDKRILKRIAKFMDSL